MLAILFALCFFDFQRSIHTTLHTTEKCRAIKKRHTSICYFPYNIYGSFPLQHRDVKQAKINILSKKRLEQAKGKHSIQQSL